MRNLLAVLAIGTCAVGLCGASAQAQTPPEVTLTRMSDCGTSPPPVEVALRFTDVYAYGGVKIPFVFSCYLVKHGDDYMMWDTGHSMTAPGGVAPKTNLVDQLAQLKVTPDQIKLVGISHFHADHTGQVGSFPKATLLIGKGDWDGITSTPPMPGANAGAFTNWISGGGKVEPLPLDKDVFGDGTVVMLATPGHTPGHHSLLVRLKDTGPVVLSGDFVHFRENYDSNGVPSFNVNRAETIASIERVKQIAANLKATVIIQHDQRDVGKLPAFPAAAK
ncbi:MAG: N-acyl homoserine lactonase family protein [Alphaproteobacteria bacterium]|nr:N-acyl homoserine lactonase family protein [Alphaproteobacteria bacterium]